MRDGDGERDFLDGDGDFLDGDEDFLDGDGDFLDGDGDKMARLGVCLVLAIFKKKDINYLTMIFV